MSRLILLDAGHGGVNKHGDYSTYPHKMTTFDTNPVPGSTLIHEIGDKFYFYEGEFNRVIEDKVCVILDEMHVPYFRLADRVYDTPLQERIAKEHMLSDIYGSENCLLISSHANASPSRKVWGFEVFTSRGRTNSDGHATLYVDIFSYLSRHHWIDFKIRTDYQDGDPDKEADFYMVKRSKCAAILLEHDFFDNEEGVKRLCDPEVQDLYAQVQAMVAANFYKNGHSLPASLRAFSILPDPTEAENP